MVYYLLVITMTDKKRRPARYAEDGFDLDRAKRNLNNVARAKSRNRWLNFWLRVGKIALMAISLVVFLALFFLAMELISIFN